MLALIRNRVPSDVLKLAFLLVVAGGFVSCAEREKPQLFSERAAKHDSALPWNEQQKWEGQGQFGPMAEHYGDGRH